ncbi:MAG: T9SS type A sorting domain-containing protein, partial [Cytophagaceae bacterium]
VLPPAIGGSTPNDVSGTGTAGNTVHVYQNTTMGSGCDCEGEIYLGATLIPAGGIWTLTHNLGLNPADLPTITATQTTPLNSTSQFSTCSSLPVSMLWFEVTKPEEKALLKWSTVSERNNKEFEIQRSEDGIAFVSVGNVPGSGFSARQTLYSFEDDILLLSGSVYYRLKQIDSDGGFTYSPVRSLLLSNDKIEIFIRDDKELSLETFLHQDEELTMEIIDMSGRKIYSSRAQVRKGFSVYTLNAGNLAEAVYVVKIYGTNTCLIKKIGIW